MVILRTCFTKSTQQKFYPALSLDPLSTVNTIKTGVITRGYFAPSLKLNLIPVSFSIVFVGAIVDGENKNNGNGLALVPNSASKMATELLFQFTKSSVAPASISPLAEPCIEPDYGLGLDHNTTSSFD